MKNAKSIAVLSLLALTAMVPIIAAVNAQPGTVYPVPPTTGTTTVVMLVTTGGTTDPPNGTSVLTPADGTITMTATPDPGYSFAYWVFAGPYPEPQTGHPQGTLFYQNPISYTCAEGFTVYWQAVFTPTSSMAVQSQGVDVAYVVIAVVAVAAVVGVGAFLVGKRNRK